MFSPTFACILSHGACIYYQIYRSSRVLLLHVPYSLLDYCAIAVHAPAGALSTISRFTVANTVPSSFHVDHAASLPYVLAKTNFKGRVFMTHPTKAIYKWLIQDSVRLG